MIKKLVISRREGIIEGMVDDILFDLDQNYALGWSFRSEGFFSQQGFVSAKESFLGKDVLLVNQTEGMPTDLEDHICWSKDLLKNPVIDRLGREVGTVLDLVLGADGMSIKGLILQEKRMLPLREDVSVRSTVVVVPQNSVFVPLDEEKEESWWNRFWNGFS